MATNTTPDALPLPEPPTGNAAERRILSAFADVVRDSQDEYTIRAASYLAAAALRALHSRPK